MSFGYIQLYNNGLNNNSQLRRAVDFIYQRGATHEVVLTGDTYQASMQLDIDMYVNDEIVGRQTVVPYDITYSANTYTYRFHARPYSYIDNFMETEHYKQYWLNDWYSTNEEINLNSIYTNKITVDYKYGWRYNNGVEYTGNPSNNINHYTAIYSSTGNTASDWINTGNKFDYIGGVLQLKDKYILSNFDNEVGTTMGNGNIIYTPNSNKTLSPIVQYLMSYPDRADKCIVNSRFLTNAPRIQVIQKNESYNLFFLQGQTGDRQVIEADYFVIEFYNSNNEQIAYYEDEIKFIGTKYESPTGYTDTLNRCVLPCGTSDIDNIYINIDWDNVAYYTVQLFSSFPTGNPNRHTYGAIAPISEIFYFYLVGNCGPEDTRVVFLNQAGAYDYFTFTKYRQDKKVITKQTYNNRYYSTDANAPDVDVERGVKQFDIDIQQNTTLISDYLNVEWSNWLEELYLSPQVYIINNDYISPIDAQDKIYKDLIPINIKSTEVETFTKKHQKLNRYTISYELANNFFGNKGF